jgi:hypothetical protein
VRGQYAIHAENAGLVSDLDRRRLPRQAPARTAGPHPRWTTGATICHHFGVIIGKDDATFIW